MSGESESSNASSDRSSDWGSAPGERHWGGGNWEDDDRWSSWSWSAGHRTNWSVQSSNSVEHDERAAQQAFSTTRPTPAADLHQRPSVECHGDDSDEGHGEEARAFGGDGLWGEEHGVSPLSAAPTVRMKDAVNRPPGMIPSGHP